MAARIALVGDHDPAVIAHQAIPRAIELATREAARDVTATWVPTRELGRHGVAALGFQALWCVPASPYANTLGVLTAIRSARESGMPFLGTCGGFQHAILEVAQALWGVSRADHAELDPESPNPVIAPLSCSLVEETGHVRFAPGSRLAEAYGKLDSEEGYHCRFGLATGYAFHLDEGPLRATAWDDADDVRGVELDDHPFFVATLFQPERAALRGQVPAAVRAFVAAVAR